LIVFASSPLAGVKMREASVIIPDCDNVGVSLAKVHDMFRARLMDHFGGFTAVAVIGGFCGDNGTRYIEPGVEYRIAADWTPELDYKLSLACSVIAREGNQESVYLKLATGEVHFIEAPLKAEVA